VTGKITPSKVLNVHKEESLLTYENKFVHTLIDRLFIFVSKRYEKLKAASASEEVFAMEYNTAFETGGGNRMKMTLNIETADSLESTDENGSTLWDRVEKIRQIIESYKASPFCQQMGNNFIRPPVMRTNAIMKNVDLKACLILWQFIEGYDKTGYDISVSDSAQKPEQEYIEELYDLTAPNFLLFTSFTQDSGRQGEVLKTKKSKAAAPRVLKKLDKVNYEESETEEVNIPREREAAEAERLRTENEMILEQIDKIIAIEKEYYEREEQKRLEAEEKERKRQEAERKRLEEEQRRYEEEQRRLEEERRIEEEKRLAREKAEREEQERLERERIEAERLEKERLEREEQERLERERIERELAEKAEKERIKAECEELSKIIGDEVEAEKLVHKEEEEQQKREREERERIRAEKLKEMRSHLEKKSFEEIYAEYSKNPFHIIRRGLQRLISLIRQDGEVIYEGDTDEPKLIERVAAEAAAKVQAERDKKEMAEMMVLYEKYSPDFMQRTRKTFKRIFGKKRKKVYVMPAQMPPVRSPKEQRAYDKKMNELFRKYRVSIFTKLIRKIKKEY
ncbi:MAG: signal peptidase I, partial [Huintestinicola sp.]